MSNNLIVFPAARCAAANGQECRVQLSLQMSDGSEISGEVSLKAGQCLQGILRDGRGFIPLMRPDGGIHVISSDLVDRIRLAARDEDNSPTT